MSKVTSNLAYPCFLPMKSNINATKIEEKQINRWTCPKCALQHSYFGVHKIIQEAEFVLLD